MFVHKWENATHSARNRRHVPNPRPRLRASRIARPDSTAAGSFYLGLVVLVGPDELVVSTRALTTGAVAMVVAIAIMTNIVYRRGEMTPSSRPTLRTMSSMRP